MRGNAASRVYFMYPVSDDIGLIFSDSFMRGQQLAVDIGQADAVVVDHINSADTGAHKRLCGVRTDAP